MGGDGAAKDGEIGPGNRANPVLDPERLRRTETGALDPDSKTRVPMNLAVSPSPRHGSPEYSAMLVVGAVKRDVVASKRRDFVYSLTHRIDGPFGDAVEIVHGRDETEIAGLRGSLECAKDHVAVVLGSDLPRSLRIRSRCW